MTLNKLQKLVDMCKGSVHVTFNIHRDYRSTIEEELSDLRRSEAVDDDDLETSVRAEMIKRNEMVEVQFYPTTPVGFYQVFHYDLEIALDIALAIMERKDK